MRTGRYLWWVLLLAACATDGGRLQASWSGADTAQITLAATALWCAEDGFLEVVGQLGDTGVALAIFPGDSGLAGSYLVRVPGRDSVAPAPGAVLASRWFDSTTLEAWQGMGGVVAIQRDQNGLLEGTFDGRLLAVSDDRTIEMSGSFARVPLTIGGAECLAAPPDSIADTVLN